MFNKITERERERERERESGREIWNKARKEIKLFRNDMRRWFGSRVLPFTTSFHASLSLTINVGLEAKT